MSKNNRTIFVEIYRDILKRKPKCINVEVAMIERGYVIDKTSQDGFNPKNFGKLLTHYTKIDEYKVNNKTIDVWGESTIGYLHLSAFLG